MGSQFKRWLLMLVTLALMLAAPAGASAGRPDAVDPGNMQPALNPTFAPWDCWRTGAGIVCDGRRAESWTNEPIGLECDGRPVYSTGSDVRTLRRVGDADGLALSARTHVMIDETVSLQPDGSGPVLTGIARFTEHYVYLTPGDLSTRTVRITGIDLHGTAPGVGLIFHDVGIKSFDIDDNVLFAHGPHPLLEDFEGTFAKVCDAFAALGA